jgi:Zn-dependent protease with chaperone function
MTIAAIYYDGNSARQHAVELQIDPQRVALQGFGVHRNEPLAAVRISERLGRTPRLLTFADGAYCEVRDHAALDAALAAAGHRASLVERLQLSWRMALLALLACVGIAIAAYRWGLPVAAEVVAWRLPESVSRQLGRTTLAALDRAWLQPSKLDAARQQALSEGFARLRRPDPDTPPATIEFRSSPSLGANAFALPDGSVVLLDQLVGLARSDDEIDAVLAHELGHVHYRHGLRLLLQGSVVALVMTAWVGDVSTLLATLPTVVLQARYSRAFEAQADDYAAQMLLANGIAPSHLADLLQRLEQQRAAKAGESSEPAEANSYLATHPPTAERIRRLRAADAGLEPAKIGR